MKIYSLSKVLAFPFLLLAGYILVNLFMGYRSEHSILIFIPVIALVVIYIFHGVIDFWWLERHPIPLDDKMRSWFIKHSPYYNSLHEDEKRQFENRLSLYVEGREFKSVGTTELKDVPFDIKAIISSQVIRMTLFQSDYLLGDVDRVYVYKHAFPTPRNKFLHTFETHMEDGMILLSVEHALPGITQPHNFYNIAMHAYAEAYIQLHPEYNYPTVSQYGWEELEQIIGITKEVILKTCGYETLEMLAVHITVYMDFGERYKEVFPLEFDALNAIFQQYD